MKKKIILTSLALFLLVGVGICSQEPSPTPSTLSQPQQNQTKPKQTNSNHKERGSNELPLVIKIVGANEPQPKEANQTKNTNENTTANWLLVLFNGLLAIFTLGLYISTRKMWASTEKAAEAAKRSAESLPRVERAYVFAEIKHLEYLKDGDSISVSASILMKNYGRTPATLNSVCGVITLKDARINEAMLIDIPPGFILGVGIDETNPCPFNVYIHLRDEEWQNVEREGITAYCCGKIIYNDIFHVSHETGFCWEFKPRTPPQWFISSKYKDLNYYT